HTRFSRDWSSDVCSSDLRTGAGAAEAVSNATAPRTVRPSVATSSVPTIPVRIGAHLLTITAPSTTAAPQVAVNDIGSEEDFLAEIGRASCRERVELAGDR